MRPSVAQLAEEFNRYPRRTRKRHIIFRAGDGTTILDHDLEAYDGTSGSLTAWVRVDSLSKATDTAILVYYGNPCVTLPTALPKAVWDSGFKGVWHLSEDPATAGQGGIKDATANNHNGTATQIDSSDSLSGVAGHGIRFSKKDCYIDYGDVDDFDFWLDNFTVSGWVKGAPSDAALVTKSAGNGPEYDGLYVYVSISKETWTWWGAGVDDKSYVHFDVFSGDDQWHHLTAVREGLGLSEFKVYTDGVLQNAGLEDTDFTNSCRFMINRWDDHSGRPNWQTDEVRVSNTARTPDWIQTSYNTQKNPGDVGSPGFYNVGPEIVAN